VGFIKRTLQNRRGDAFVFILILVFFILTLAAILIEYFRMEAYTKKSSTFSNGA
jgi:DNA-binding transcriptional regulator of glucitol operon